MYHYVQVSASALGRAAVPEEARASLEALEKFFDELGPPPAGPVESW